MMSNRKKCYYLCWMKKLNDLYTLFTLRTPLLYYTFTVWSFDLLCCFSFCSSFCITVGCASVCITVGWVSWAIASVCAAPYVHVYVGAQVCVAGFCLWIVCFCSFSNTVRAQAAAGFVLPSLYLRLVFTSIYPMQSSIYTYSHTSRMHTNKLTQTQLQNRKTSSSSWSTMSCKCVCVRAFSPNKLSSISLWFCTTFNRAVKLQLIQMNILFWGIDGDVASF